MGTEKKKKKQVEIAEASYLSLEDRVNLKEKENKVLLPS